MDPARSAEPSYRGQSNPQGQGPARPATAVAADQALSVPAGAGEGRSTVKMLRASFDAQIAERIAAQRRLDDVSRKKPMPAASRPNVSLTPFPGSVPSPGGAQQLRPPAAAVLPFPVPGAAAVQPRSAPPFVPPPVPPPPPFPAGGGARPRGPFVLPSVPLVATPTLPVALKRLDTFPKEGQGRAVPDPSAGLGQGVRLVTNSSKQGTAQTGIPQTGTPRAGTESPRPAAQGLANVPPASTPRTAFQGTGVRGDNLEGQGQEQVQARMKGTQVVSVKPKVLHHELEVVDDEEGDESDQIRGPDQKTQKTGQNEPKEAGLMKAYEKEIASLRKQLIRMQQQAQYDVSYYQQELVALQCELAEERATKQPGSGLSWSAVDEPNLRQQVISVLRDSIQRMQNLMTALKQEQERNRDLSSQLQQVV